MAFCIENVAGAPIRHDLMLCGEMFGLKVIRHRYFEIHGFSVAQPEHIKHRGMAAIQALERVIGSTDDWYQISAYAIQMMGAGYEERQALYDHAMDLLHDILCEFFPDSDDGVRYVKKGGVF